MSLKGTATFKASESGKQAIRVKSVKFGHRVNSVNTFANSGNPDQTAPYEPSHQDFHCLLS